MYWPGPISSQIQAPAGATLASGPTSPGYIGRRAPPANPRVPERLVSLASQLAAMRPLLDKLVGQVERIQADLNTCYASVMARAWQPGGVRAYVESDSRLPYLASRVEFAKLCQWELDSWVVDLDRQLTKEQLELGHTGHISVQDWHPPNLDFTRLDKCMLVLHRETKKMSILNSILSHHLPSDDALTSMSEAYARINTQIREGQKMIVLMFAREDAEKLDPLRFTRLHTVYGTMQARKAELAASNAAFKQILLSRGVALHQRPTDLRLHQAPAHSPKPRAREVVDLISPSASEPVADATPESETEEIQEPETEPTGKPSKLGLTGEESESSVENEAQMMEHSPVAEIETAVTAETHLGEIEETPSTASLVQAMSPDVQVEHSAIETPSTASLVRAVSPDVQVEHSAIETPSTASLAQAVSLNESPTDSDSAVIQVAASPISKASPVEVAEQIFVDSNSIHSSASSDSVVELAVRRLGPDPDGSDGLGPDHDESDREGLFVDSDDDNMDDDLFVGARAKAESTIEATPEETAEFPAEADRSGSSLVARIRDGIKSFFPTVAQSMNASVESMVLTGYTDSEGSPSDTPGSPPAHDGAAKGGLHEASRLPVPGIVAPIHVPSPPAPAPAPLPEPAPKRMRLMLPAGPDSRSQELPPRPVRQDGNVVIPPSVEPVTKRKIVVPAARSRSGRIAGAGRTYKVAPTRMVKRTPSGARPPAAVSDQVQPDVPVPAKLVPATPKVTAPDLASLLEHMKATLAARPQV